MFQDKSLLEQILIVIKHKGVSLTAVSTLLIGGGLWQKDNIVEFLYPPFEPKPYVLAEHRESPQPVSARVDVLLKDFNTRLYRHTELPHHKDTATELEKHDDAIIQQRMIAVAHVNRLDAISKQIDSVSQQMFTMVEELHSFESKLTEVASRQTEQINTLKERLNGLTR